MHSFKSSYAIVGSIYMSYNTCTYDTLEVKCSTILTPSYTYDVELYILSCLQGKLIETALTTPLVI